MNYFVKFSKSKTLKVFVFDFDFESFPFSPKCLGILLTLTYAIIINILIVNLWTSLEQEDKTTFRLECNI